MAEGQETGLTVVESIAHGVWMKIPHDPEADQAVEIIAQAIREAEERGRQAGRTEECLVCRDLVGFSNNAYSILDARRKDIMTAQEKTDVEQRI